MLELLNFVDILLEMKKQNYKDFQRHIEQNHKDFLKAHLVDFVSRNIYFDM